MFLENIEVKDRLDREVFVLAEFLQIIAHESQESKISQLPNKRSIYFHKILTLHWKKKIQSFAEGLLEQQHKGNSLGFEEFW